MDQRSDHPQESREKLMYVSNSGMDLDKAHDLFGDCCHQCVVVQVPGIYNIAEKDKERIKWVEQ